MRFIGQLPATINAGQPALEGTRTKLGDIDRILLVQWCVRSTTFSVPY